MVDIIVAGDHLLALHDATFISAGNAASRNVVQVWDPTAQVSPAPRLPLCTPLSWHDLTRCHHLVVACDTHWLALIDNLGAQRFHPRHSYGYCKFDQGGHLRVLEYKLGRLEYETFMLQ